MGLLKFDFNKANAQIQELEEIASEIDQLAATDYENLMQQMRSAWKGSAADAYIRKASQVQERIKNTSRDIKKNFGSLCQCSEKSTGSRGKSQRNRKRKKLRLTVHGNTCIDYMCSNNCSGDCVDYLDFEKSL